MLYHFPAALPVLLSLLLLTSFTTVGAQPAPRARAGELLAEAIDLKADFAYKEALAQIITADSLLLNAPPDSLASEIAYLHGLLAYNLGDYGTAKAKFSAAGAWFAANGVNGRLADCLVWTGQAKWYTEGTDTALAYFERAISTLESTEATDGHYRGKFYADKGIAYAYLGQLSRTRQWVDRGVAIDRKHFGNYDRRVAETLYSRATYFQFTDDHPRALATYEEILAIYDSIHPVANTPDHAVVYASLGRSCVMLEQYQRAEDYYLRALPILEDKFLASHYNVLLCHTALGELYHNLGQKEKAIYHHRMVRENNTENLATVAAAARIGETFDLENAGRYQEANELLLVLEADENTVRQGSNDQALLLERVGQNYLYLGIPDSARIYLRKARTIYATLDYPKSTDLGRMAALLAKSFLFSGSADSVRFYAQEGIDLLWEPHQDFSRILNPDVFTLLLQLKGNALVARGDAADALEVFMWGDRYFTYLLGQYGYAEDKFTLQEQIDEFHRKAIKLCFELANDQPDLRDTALMLSEKNKAYQLLETVRKAGIPKLETFLAERRAVQAGINFYQKQLSEPSGEFADDGAAKLKASIAELRARAVGMERDAMRAHPRLLAAAAGPDYLGVSEIRGLLKPEEAVVEYVVDGQDVYLFLITTKEFHTQKITSEIPPEELVREMRAAMTVRTSDGLRRYIISARKLYNVLIGPVAKKLPPKLIVIPDGALHFLPFEALLGEDVDVLFRPESYPYFLREYLISYAHSATLLESMRKNKRTNGKPDGTVLAMAPFSETAPPGSGQASRNDGPFAPLPGTGRELDMIKKQWAAAECYYGREATLARFRERAAASDNILLATHAVAGKDNFLVFAGGENAPQSYQRLYLRDLYAMRLKATLVTLSACDSNTGELVPGEGLMSLTRGFIHAGAGGLISTMWSVEDGATEALITDFYRFYRAGETPELALRKAKLNYLDGHAGMAVRPALWAGLVFFGG